MYTSKQSLDCHERIDADRRESTPTPVWHLAKSANVDEKDMLYFLGNRGIEVFRFGPDRLRHISKADVRRIMGLESAE